MELKPPSRPLIPRCSIHQACNCDGVYSCQVNVNGPLFRVDRVASRDVTIGDGLKIPKGTIVNLPIYAIHHSPEKWPEPETFDPER